MGGKARMNCALDYAFVRGVEGERSLTVPLQFYTSSSCKTVLSTLEDPVQQKNGEYKNRKLLGLKRAEERCAKWMEEDAEALV
ncbi:hypothetical protein quinque_000473 [Culex quinquefasciatus]